MVLKAYSCEVDLQKIIFLAPFDDLTKCVVDGKTYYEGQKFSPSEEPGSSCVCQKGFKSEFVEPFCRKTQCLTQIRHSRDIDNDCAPVYFNISGSPGNCPFNFLCRK